MDEKRLNALKESLTPLTSNENLKKLLKDRGDLIKMAQDALDNNIGVRKFDFSDIPISNIHTENNKVLKEIDDKLQTQIANQERQITKQETLIEKQDVIINALVNNIKSVNYTLELILNSLGANSQKTQVLLCELQSILSDTQKEKESEKLKKFMKDHGIEAFAAVLQIVSMGLGK